MNKIFAWLTGSVIKEVGNVIDKFTTTKEEKLEANRQIQIIQTLLVTAYGAYFVGRSWEKGKQIMNKKNT